MAQGILVIAESGAGKSTSIENLDPKETFIINVANKPLPFKGWKKKYIQWSKDNPTGNLYTGSSAQQIEAALGYINSKRPEIKTIVIDDFQYMSSFEFFDRSDEEGYEKFTQIGANLARIARMPKDLRDDLTIFFLTHAEESTDLEGKRKFKAKTIGRMVDEKLSLEGLDWIEARLLAGHEALTAVKPEKKITIALEDLAIKNREATYKKLLGFLKVTDEPAMQDFFTQSMTPDAATSGRWKSEIDSPEFSAGYAAMTARLIKAGVVFQ